MTKLTYATYLPLARLTEGPYPKLDVPGLKPYNAARIIHMALGLATEALELQTASSRADQLLELSDICWFAALACEELATPPGGIVIYPTQGLPVIYSLIEQFASRVKAGLAYGNADKVGMFWQRLPAEIFGRAVAIGNAALGSTDDILSVNIRKLRARYGDKFSAHDALNRDTAAETSAAFGEPAARIVAPATADDLAEILRENNSHI